MVASGAGSSIVGNIEFVLEIYNLWGCIPVKQSIYGIVSEMYVLQITGHITIIIIIKLEPES